MADLQVSVGDLFGSAPADAIIDPVSGNPVAAGSLVLLIYDSDADGSLDDVDMSDGTPINQDLEVGRFAIGDGGFPQFDVGGGSYWFRYAELNAVVDVTPGVNGDTGQFYLRVFNVADPSQGGEIRWGDSYESNPAIVTLDPSDVQITGGSMIYTETPPDDPVQRYWNTGGVVLDQAPPGGEQPCESGQYARLLSDFVFLNQSPEDFYAAQWLGSFDITITEDLLDNLTIVGEGYQVRPFELLEDKGSLRVSAPAPDVANDERFAKFRYFGLSTTSEGTAMQLTFISKTAGFEKAMTVTLMAMFNDDSVYSLDELTSMETIAALFDSGISDITMDQYLFSGAGNIEIGRTLPIDVINERSESEDNVGPSGSANLDVAYQLVDLSMIQGVPSALNIMESFQAEIVVDGDADIQNFGAFLLIDGVDIDMSFLDDQATAYGVSAIDRIIMVNEYPYPVAYIYGYADQQTIGFDNDYVITVMKITFETETFVWDIQTLEDLCAVFSADWENTALSLQTESSFVADIVDTAQITGGCAQTEPLQYTLEEAGWHALNFAELPAAFRAGVESLENVSFRVNGVEVPFGEDHEGFYFQVEEAGATVCVLPYRTNPERQVVPGFPVNGPTQYVDRDDENTCVWQSQSIPSGIPRNLLIQLEGPDLVFAADGRLIEGGYEWFDYRYIGHTTDITVVSKSPYCITSVISGPPTPFPFPPPPLPVPAPPAD